MSDVRLVRRTVGGGVEQLMRQSRPGLVKVGVLQGAGEHNNATQGQTVAEIAWWNEFGTALAPARPFLRTGLLENLRELRAIISTGLPKVLKKEMTISQLQSLLGAAGAAKVQQKIVDLRTPGNEESTKKKKGSSNPLIDTGQLRQNISWEKID